MNEPPPPIELPTTYEDLELDRLDAIIRQNRTIITTLAEIADHGDGKRFYVKIADANMPFFALVGLLVKIAIASIPAMLILGALAIGFVIVASAVGIGIGSGARFAPSAISVPTVRAMVTVSPQPTRTTQPTRPAQPTANLSFGLLNMLAVSNRIEGDSYIVEGQVKNIDSTALQDAVALVIFRRENGNEQEVRVPIAPVPLAPGDIGNFAASTPAEGVSSFRVDFANQSGRSIPFRDTAP